MICIVFSQLYRAPTIELPSNRTSEMATKAVLEDFNVEELCDFLSNSTELSEDAVAKFRTHRISGSILFELGEVDLKELLPILGERKLVQRLISSYLPSPAVSV